MNTIQFSKPIKDKLHIEIPILILQSLVCINSCHKTIQLSLTCFNGPDQNLPFYDALFIDVHKDKSDNFELTDFAMEFLERNKIKKIKEPIFTMTLLILI